MEDSDMKTRTDFLSLLFYVSLWWRIVYGTLKGTLGLVLLGLIQLDIARVFYTIMSRELIEDPNDLFIIFVGPIVQRISSHSNYFLAAYLIFWGALDIFLSISLLREKLWAYHVAFVVISLFVAYELYRISHTHSIFLAFIIAVDIFVLWFIRREHKHARDANVAPV